MDGVEIQRLGPFGDEELAFAGAFLGLVTFLEVGLGVPDHFADELGELCGMLGLFPCVALEGFGDLGVAFSIGLAAHRQVHAHFGAFAGEVFLEARPDLRVTAFGNAQDMLGGILGRGRSQSAGRVPGLLQLLYG